MKIPKPTPKPEIVGDVDERFAMPAKNVWPQPIGRRLVLVLFAMIGLGFVGTGAGTLYALHYIDQNVNQLETRRLSRDAERDNFERQIRALQQRQQTESTRNTKAICTLAIGSIQTNIRAGTPTSPLVYAFAEDYGCTLPAGLQQPPS